MSNGWLIAVAGAAALTLVGCSSPTATIATPTSTVTSTAAHESTESSSTSSTQDTPGQPLDGEACVEITGANLDLATASNTGDARTAADTLEKYGPPQSVTDAIEHFVGTEGAQFDDPNYKQDNDAIDTWVRHVCPS